MFIWQLDKSWQIKLYNEDHPDAFDEYRLRDFNVVARLTKASMAPFPNPKQSIIRRIMA